MKRLMLVFVVLMALVGVVALAGAVNCANNDQIIMRLNRGANAHGALWSEASYETKICYDDIFNELFAGANAHTGCGGVLKLSASVNAHAESYSFGNYGTPVCHAGLTNCAVNRASDGCGTKKAIVYLSAMTNAHLSKTPAEGFNYTVCCEKSTGEVISTCAGITSCSGYSYNDCQINDRCSIASSDSGCNPSDGDLSRCYCKWEGSSAAGNCKVAWDNTIGGCTYTCEISTTQTDCVDDLMDITINANVRQKSGNCASVIANPPEDCKDSTVTGVPCKFAITELPFFGMWQFAISLISIALIYFVIRRGK